MPESTTTYLDHNATTPLRPEVLEAMLPYLTEMGGNPSSIHQAGQAARAGLDLARARIARLLSCEPEEVHFTSGGTEADNWAIKGVMARTVGSGGRIVTTSIEHHAVWHTCEYLEQRGYDVVYIPVDGTGVVDVADVVRAMDGGDSALVSVMHGNNETGAIQPLAEIGRAARERGIPFHTDAVQSFGKLPVHPEELSADLISVSAHKINGPKGTGALYIRSGTPIEAQSHGGDHEGGLRAGTENVAGIVGFGMAAQLRERELDSEDGRMCALRDRLENATLDSIDEVTVNGHPVERLSNTSNLSFRGVEAEAVVIGLDLEGIAVSSGSACTAGTTEPSHVLRAMGLEPRLAASSVRFSLGWGTTEEDVDRVSEVLPAIVERLRRLSPAL